MDRGILDLLRNDGCITVNKRLIRALGLIEAVVYSELASRHCYFKERDRLDGSGYFFNTKEDLERGTGATRRQQDAAVKHLIDLGLIEMVVKGIPATRHFRFTAANLRAVTELLTGVKERTPEELLLDAFQAAGATAKPTDEVKELAAEAIRRGKARVKAKARWG